MLTELGNRLTDIQNRSYTYNNGNELLNYDGVSFQYDANGNIVSKTDNCGTTTYSYDSENRLIGINGFTINCSLFTANYKYDPFGRRIEKNVNGVITRYVYDREDILFELDGNNNIITEYLHGPGIDEPIAMLRNNQTYYYHADGLGSIIAITDSSGRVVQRYEYDSFGQITYVQDQNFVQPYTYTGREYDTESGLYYYRARYYDAKIGRFISEDPFPGFLFKPLTLNPYPYVQSNPVNRIDSDGKMSVVVGGAIVVGAAGAVIGFTACMNNCFGLPGDACPSNDASPTWAQEFAKCAQLCTTPTILWKFMWDPFGAGSETIGEKIGSGEQSH